MITIKINITYTVLFIWCIIAEFLIIESFDIILRYCLKLRIVLGNCFLKLESSIHEPAWLTPYSISSFRSILDFICTAKKFIWLPDWHKITQSSLLVYQTKKIFFCNWSYIQNWLLSKILVYALYWTSRINWLKPGMISFLKAISIILKLINLLANLIPIAHINRQLLRIIHQMF